MLRSRWTQHQAKDNLPGESTIMFDVNFQVLLGEHIFSLAGDIYMLIPQVKPFGIKVWWHHHKSYNLKVHDEYDMKKVIITCDNVVYNKVGIYKWQKETNSVKMAKNWWKVHAFFLYFYMLQTKGI